MQPNIVLWNINTRKINCANFGRVTMHHICLDLELHCCDFKTDL